MIALTVTAVKTKNRNRVTGHLLAWYWHNFIISSRTAIKLIQKPTDKNINYGVNSLKKKLLDITVFKFGKGSYNTVCITLHSFKQYGYECVAYCLYRSTFNYEISENLLW